MRRTLLASSCSILAFALACSDDGSGGSPSTGGSGGDGGSGATGSAGGPTNGGGGVGGVGAAGGQGAAGPGPGGSGGAGAGGEDPFAGPLLALQEVDLGTADIGDDLDFPIPDRTIGLTTLSETNQAGFFGVTRLRPPGANATSIIFEFEIPGTDLPWFIDEGALTSANPLSELPNAWPIVEGPWRLRLAADESPTTARSRVFVRRTNDGVFHGGVMDVNVIIAPGVAGSNYMSQVVDSLFDDYYEPEFGVTLGEVAFYAADSSFTTVSSASEYDQMLQTSAGAGAAPAVNIFVIGGFSGELGGALGVAGGIPGSPMVHGTSKSGVAYIPSGDPSYDGSVLAHEIGHLGGLFHTTENAPGIFDPFSDTPQCQNLNNPNACPDVGNIMFPIAYGGGNFSALQARTLQGSALYRGILDAGGPPAPSLTPAPPGGASLARWETSLEPAVDGARLFGPTDAWPARDDDARWLLAGHWCSEGSRATRADLAARIFDAHYRDQEETLLAYASDPTSPSLVRGRALELLRLFAEPGDATARAAEVARAILDEAFAGRAAKLEALTLLEEGAWLSTAARDELAATEVDPVIVHALRRR